MGTVLALALLRSWRRVLAMAVGFGIFELIVGLSYASVDENKIRSLVEELPPAIRALASSADIASPSGYLGSGFYHPVALTLQAALVISMAAMAARDMEDGPAELMLSRPLPRWRWLLAHAAALVAGLIVVALGGWLGGAIAASTVDALAPVELGSLTLVSLGGFLCFLVVGAVALVTTVLSHTAGRAIGWAAAFALVSYALNYLAQVWTVVEPLGPLSVFHYYDPAKILGQADLPGADVLVMALGAALVGLAAHLTMQRRELAP
jgi:ABC-type transport system involved in multi-copper enzyme maturation permease subunit